MGTPTEPRYQETKKEIEPQGFEVNVLAMPNPEEPEISSWVSTLSQAVGKPDEETFFLGNSVGCQTILRYLESLEEDTKVGGAVFSAGWVNLLPEALEDEEDAAVAEPWLETPPNFNKVTTHTNKFTAIFSDNDPYVPLTDKDIFKEKLDAKIIVENNKDHFPGYDKGENYMVVVEEILEMSK